VNHFFIDVEHRMRVTLSNKAPERVVKGYMREMRDQWAGAGIALDIGLIGSDAELSGAVWRNIFAARGLDGKGEVIGKPGTNGSARAVQSPDQSAGRADASSVDTSHLPLSERELADLPFHLFVFTAYLRRELKRLESIPDEDVLAGEVGSFGSLESHMHATEREFALEQEERALLGLDEDGQIEPLHARSRSKGKVAAAA
jgi:cytochrome b pre-mRNA-processing protein 3